MTIKNILIYYFVLNLTTFIIYGVDKYKAIKNYYRISEETLLGMAIVGGGIGALSGMKIFHHKTRKTKFVVTVPATIVLHVFVFAYLLTKII